MKPKCAKKFEKLPTKLTKVGPTGGAENARRENDGPSCRTWKHRTWKCRTSSAWCISKNIL